MIIVVYLFELIELVFTGFGLNQPFFTWMKL